MNRKQLIQRQQELLNTAKAAERELTAEEQAEFDEIQRQITAMDAGTGSGEEPEVNPEAERAAAMTAERQRCAEITNLCREFNVSAENERSYIEQGVSVDGVRKAILDGMKADGAPVSTRGRAEVTSDAQDKFRAAAGDAIVMRSGINIEKPAEGARELMHMSLRDLAIECLSAEGQTGLNRKSAEELFNLASRQFFNPTSAFPAILDNAINKAYVEGHKNVAVTFDQWTKKGTLKDFKTADNNYLAGPAGEFLEVPEGAELKHDVFEDKKRPTRKLKTSVENTIQTFGGSDRESDDSLKERAYEIPNSYSTAGPVGAYSYFVKEIDQSITDVIVKSDTPGVVQIIFITDSGKPDAALIQKVEDALADRNVRPLTDKVEISGPKEQTYNLDMTYYISSSEKASVAAIQTNVDAAVTIYNTWQTERIGRDINPSYLIQKVMEAGAKRVTVASPAFTVLANDTIAKIGKVTVKYGGLEDD